MLELWNKAFPKKRPLELFATLWPGFAHFSRFVDDSRLAGIRVNPPGIRLDELRDQFATLDVASTPMPLWYDVKGRQLRVVEADHYQDHLEIVLNHPIWVDLSDESARVVLFKAGGDSAVIDRIVDNGQRLIFRPGREFGPAYQVNYGESLHLRHPSLRVTGSLFTDEERQKIELAKTAGFKRFYLSYVESQQDVAQLRELVGHDREIWLKIENLRGLEFVERSYRKQPNTTLVAARGDLFVEVERPHEIAEATRLIIAKDPDACIGSRILLSIARRAMPPEEKKRALQALHEAAGQHSRTLQDLLTLIFHDPVPDCVDWSELNWLADIGYRRFLLCDELCLSEPMLDTALNAFSAFASSYEARL